MRSTNFWATFFKNFLRGGGTGCQNVKMSNVICVLIMSKSGTIYNKYLLLLWAEMTSWKWKWQMTNDNNDKIAWANSLIYSAHRFRLLSFDGNSKFILDIKNIKIRAKSPQNLHRFTLYFGSKKPQISPTFAPKLTKTALNYGEKHQNLSLWEASDDSLGTLRVSERRDKLVWSLPSVSNVCGE